MYVCRYTEQYQYACDFVICENCYNKHNSTRSRQNNDVDAQRLPDMFYPFLNKHTGEAQFVENPLEYHKLQYIWIPSWQSKNGKNCRTRHKESKKEFIILAIVAKVAKRVEV